MATVRVRALSVALLLAFCFVCVRGAERQPTNKYISYAAPRGGSRGCPVTNKGCNPYRDGIRRIPTEPGAAMAGTGGATAAYTGDAALQRVGHPIPIVKAGAGSNEGRYIRHDALSKDKQCGPFGCRPSRP